MKRLECRILLVEDNSDDVELFRLMLAKQTFSRRKYHIEHCWTIREAVKELSKQEFSIALVDLTLPDSSGKESYQGIQKNDPKLPVIVLTNTESEDLANELISMGAQDYIEKSSLRTCLLDRVIQNAIQRKKMERELRDKQNNLEILFNTVPAGIFIVEKESGIIEDANPAAERMLGLSRIDILQRPMTDFLPNEDDDIPQSNLNESEDATLISEHGAKLEVLYSAATYRQDDREYIIATILDITSRKKAEKELRHQATHDSMTELLNRGHFMSVVDHHRNIAIRYKSPLSVCICDLDKFKQVNDEYGHPVGDELLVEFARQLKIIIRETDYACRYGGEEFAVLFPNTDKSGAEQCMERLLEKFSKHVFEAEGQEFSVSATFGVTDLKISDEKYESAQQFLTRADDALYHGKETGRNKVVLA